MDIIQQLFEFMAWFASQEITIGEYSFSLIGSIVFCGALCVIIRFLEFFFDV